MKANLISLAVLFIVVTVLTLAVLYSYEPSPVLDVLNDCTVEIVGNCSVK